MRCTLVAFMVLIPPKWHKMEVKVETIWNKNISRFSISESSSHILWADNFLYHCDNPLTYANEANKFISLLFQWDEYIYLIAPSFSTLINKINIWILISLLHPVRQIIIIRSSHSSKWQMEDNNDWWALQSLKPPG